MVEEPRAVVGVFDERMKPRPDAAESTSLDVTQADDTAIEAVDGLLI